LDFTECDECFQGLFETCCPNASFQTFPAKYLILLLHFNCNIPCSKSHNSYGSCPPLNLDWAGSSNFLPGDSVTLSLFFFEQSLAFPAGERREVSKDRCKFRFQGSRENKWESILLSFFAPCDSSPGRQVSWNMSWRHTDKDNGKS
jgi:hypothetical protein